MLLPSASFNGVLFSARLVALILFSLSVKAEKTRPCETGLASGPQMVTPLLKVRDRDAITFAVGNILFHEGWDKDHVRILNLLDDLERLPADSNSREAFFYALTFELEFLKRSPNKGRTQYGEFLAQELIQYLYDLATLVRLYPRDLPGSEKSSSPLLWIETLTGTPQKEIFTSLVKRLRKVLALVKVFGSPDSQHQLWVKYASDPKQIRYVITTSAEEKSFQDFEFHDLKPYGLFYSEFPIVDALVGLVPVAILATTLTCHSMNVHSHLLVKPEEWDVVKQTAQIGISLTGLGFHSALFFKTLFQVIGHSKKDFWKWLHPSRALRDLFGSSRVLVAYGIPQNREKIFDSFLFAAGYERLRNRQVFLTDLSRQDFLGTPAGDLQP